MARGVSWHHYFMKVSTAIVTWLKVVLVVAAEVYFFYFLILIPLVYFVARLVTWEDVATDIACSMWDFRKVSALLTHYPLPPERRLSANAWNIFEFAWPAVLWWAGFKYSLRKATQLSFGMIGGILLLAGGLWFFGEEFIQNFIQNVFLENTLHACVTGLSAFFLGRGAALTRLNVRGHRTSPDAA